LHHTGYLTVVGRCVTATVAGCSMLERSFTPNMMVPRHSSSMQPGSRASVEHHASSRPITPATGRQSQMIGSFVILFNSYKFSQCPLLN